MYDPPTQLSRPKRPHEHKDPTNHGFWYPPIYSYIGPWKQNVGSLCFCGVWGPTQPSALPKRGQALNSWDGWHHVSVVRRIEQLVLGEAAGQMYWLNGHWCLLNCCCYHTPRTLTITIPCIPTLVRIGAVRCSHFGITNLLVVTASARPQFAANCQLEAKAVSSNSIRACASTSGLSPSAGLD